MISAVAAKVERGHALALMGASRHPYVSEVAVRLKDLLRSRGLSLTATERAMGKEDAYLRQAIAGSKRLTLDLVVEVLDHIGVSPAEFFAPPGPPEPDPDTIAEELSRYSPGEVLEALARALVRKGVISPEDLKRY